MAIFSCKKEALCCSNIRGRLTPEDRHSLSDLSFGKMPLVQLVPVEKVSFPLFEWEKEMLDRAAEKKGIKLSVRPLRAVYDLESDTTLIVSWYLDHDSCPMLVDNQCSCYGGRPMVCKMFPFNSSPLSENPPAIADFCPGCEGLASKDTPTLDRFFGENLLWAVQNDLVVEKMNGLVIRLIKDKVIRPAVNYPYKFLLKRIEGSRKMTLFEFLIDKKVSNEKRIGDLVREMSDLSLANQRLYGLMKEDGPPETHRSASPS